VPLAAIDPSIYDRLNGGQPVPANGVDQLLSLDAQLAWLDD
jgi:hypothetical protein